MTASLYIHIPFCGSENGKRCDYCDFFSVPIYANNNNALLDSFVEAALDDVKDQISVFNIYEIPTIYIGGGTPSVLGPNRMRRLLDGLTLLAPVKKPSAEFTVEANPESVDKPFLQACIDGGVNRISLGIQSFHAPSRQAVNRAGGLSSRDLEESLSLAAEFFPGAFSADLISGLPYSTAKILLNDIKRLLAFNISHVSLYSLILEAETPLGKKVSQKEVSALPQGDEADSLWIAGRNALEKSGLVQYEVSNFALPGKERAHNIRYWRMENWLGIGPSASGTLIDEAAGVGKRFTYPSDIAAYLTAERPRIRSSRAEELNRQDLLQETLLMGFRCREGPDPNLFRQRFGCGIEDCIPNTITRWQKRGFFAENRRRLAPSREGLLFLNSFLRDAFAEIQNDRW